MIREERCPRPRWVRYFVYVCIRDPGRARDLEARKEAERRMKERMGTVSLS